MTTTYTNCAPTDDLLARSARAVYLVTLQQSDAFFSWLQGSSWPDIVAMVEDAIGTTPGLQGNVGELGSASVTASDTVGTIVLQALQSGVTVGQVVTLLNNVTNYAQVSGVSYFADVPGYQSSLPGTTGTGPTSVAQAAGNTQQTAQQVANATPSFLQEVEKWFATAGTYTLVGLALVAAIVVVPKVSHLVNPPRRRRRYSR